MTMTNIIVNGKVTATSKKTSDNFKQEIATKTAYLQIAKEDIEKVKEFGLTEYTSSEKESFFVVKMPANVMVYLPNGFGTKRPDLSRIEIDGEETNNFKTPDDTFVKLSILKGNHKKNDFYRLQAIRVTDESDIEEIKPDNPFGDSEAF